MRGLAVILLAGRWALLALAAGEVATPGCICGLSSVGRVVRTVSVDAGLPLVAAGVVLSEGTAA